MTDRGRANDTPPCSFELSEARRVERMDCCDSRASERAVELTPLSCRNDGSGRQAKRRKERTNTDRIRRKHFTDQRHRRLVGSAFPRRLNGTLLCFRARVVEHCGSEDVLGFRMRAVGNRYGPSVRRLDGHVLGPGSGIMSRGCTMQKL